MRTGVMLVLAALTAWAGGWFIANYRLAERVSQVAIGAKSLCSATRGNAPVSRDDLTARFMEIASDNALEASDVQLTITPVRPDGASMAAQVAGQLALLTKGKLQANASEVTVTARVRGSQWLWKVDDEITSSCVMQGSITRSGP